jgi:hypothetical protein
MANEYKCGLCGRGKEACQYCEGMALEDFEVCCDCGLYDFGRHLELVKCHTKSELKYVVAATFEGSLERREQS